MTDFHERIASLSPDQRRVLEQRLSGLIKTSNPPSQIHPRDREHPAPLSTTQRREWAISRFRGVNNITGALRLGGQLDRAALARAISAVIERHEVLRSRIELTPQGPVQEVLDTPDEPPLSLVDLRYLSADDQHAELQRFGREDVRNPFPADSPVKLHVTLVQLADDLHVALFATDHAAADAWSLAWIAQDLVGMYQALHGDTPAPAAPTLQFADYATWQHSQLTEDSVDQETAHWINLLRDLPADTGLPTDRPRPAEPTYHGGNVVRLLSPELTSRLHDLEVNAKVSLFPIFMAASTALLGAYLDSDDLVIGSLVSGRTRAETERMIGCFANPLPLRIHLDAAQSYSELLQSCNSTLADVLDHQDAPLDKVIQSLGVDQAEIQTSLSRFWLNVLTGPQPHVDLPGLQISTEPVDLEMASVELTLTVQPLNDRLVLAWQYMTEVYDQRTVELYAEQLECILAHMVDHPSDSVGQAPLQVSQWVTIAPAPCPPTVVEVIDSLAADDPDAAAVIVDGHITTRAELRHSAHQLARQLRSNGVGPGDRVAIYTPRSSELAIAIMGVLTAGACYVPIDVSFPAERVAYLLRDAGCRLILTRSDTSAAVAAHDLPVYEVDHLPHTDTSLTDPIPLPDLGDAAYIVYTSGSTGQPKGTLINHRALTTYAHDTAQRLRLGAADRFLQFASPSFDVLAEELFPTWVAGGAVSSTTSHIISGEVDLVDVIASGITVIELPTAYWQEWLRQLDRNSRQLPACLRTVIIGGERVLPERVEMWRRTGVELLHVYGLTETTVSSTFFTVDPASTQQWANLPIGTPLPSAELHLLNSELAPAPLGAVAELYIGGVSVADGYLDRPGLTAQRFIADPRHPGQRLYRTGDLCRQRVDGNLEFISRVDEQVKIRGFRVEPTEVASVIARHPSVGDCFVSVYEPKPTDRRLVAYVVPAHDQTIDSDVLRSFASQRVPAHEVPAHFVVLEALPLNANGKVDKKRLPSVVSPQHASPTPAASSSVQTQLLRIIRDVVGDPSITAQDNFFEAGGDSILAIQVVNTAQEAGLRLSPYDLFTHPSVAALADLAAAGAVIDAAQTEVTGPVALTGIQRLRCCTVTPDAIGPSITLELHRSLDPALLSRALEHLLVHHDGLRQRLLVNGLKTRARLAPIGDAAGLTLLDLTAVDPLTTTQHMAAAREQLATTLSTTVGPVFAAALISTPQPNHDQLLLMTHPLVADLPSLDSIVADLETLMVQLASDEEIRLLPKTTSWPAWCRRLADADRSGAYDAQQSRWESLARSGDDPTNTPHTWQQYVRVIDDARSILTVLPRQLNHNLEEIIVAAIDAALDELPIPITPSTIDVLRDQRDHPFADVDVTRTIGLFTHPQPVQRPDREQPWHDRLSYLSTQLRTAPEAGRGWAMLAAPNHWTSRSQVAVYFQGVRAIPQSGTFHIALRTPSDLDLQVYSLSVCVEVIHDALHLSVMFDPSLWDAATVEQLTDHVQDRLQPSGHDDATTQTSYDQQFPLAGADADTLGRLLSSLSRAEADPN